MHIWVKATRELNADAYRTLIRVVNLELLKCACIHSFILALFKYGILSCISVENVKSFIAVILENFYLLLIWAFLFSNVY